LEFSNDCSSLKEAFILPSGSVYFAMRGKKNGKIVSTKLLPLMHCKKVGYFLRSGVIYLENTLKSKTTFIFSQNR